MLEYNIISSSSNGNCIIVKNSLMLDCGVSYKKIKPYLDKVRIIFISHIHKDHLNPKTIKQIVYNYPTIRFLSGNREVTKNLYLCGVQPSGIIYMPNDNKWYDMRLLKFKMQPIEHDVMNTCLHFEMCGKKGIYIVDTNNVDDIKAKDYDLYLIESNYNQDILQQHIDNCEDESELYYLNRVPRTHLSFEQANSFLLENMKEDSWFAYIHQSSYNFVERD